MRLPQLFASGLVSPLIYILAFGFGLGSSLSQPPMGNSYLEFILPGMVALSSMIISFAGTTFSICGDRLFNKTFEELLLAPVHPLGVYVGKVLAGVVRGLLTALAIILISVIFTGNRWGFLHPLFLFLVFLNCLVFAGLGVIVGLSVASLETVGLYNNFLIVPMSFLGGYIFRPQYGAGLAQGGGVCNSVDLRQCRAAGGGFRGRVSLVCTAGFRGSCYGVGGHWCPSVFPPPGLVRACSLLGKG